MAAATAMVLLLLALSAGVGAGAGADGLQAARAAGAVRLGALFAVHGAPAAAAAAAKGPGPGPVQGAGAAAAAAGRCGPVREHYGIQRVEAALQALDAVNAAPLLRGLRLGAELRDSCWAAPTALRQTIELVRHALTAPPPPASATATTHGRDGSCSRRHEPDDEDGDSGWQQSAPLLGVLGPGASAAAAHVQNLLQLFNIPQVSYSATSRELSDRTRFATFFRVVPSDAHQARLLAALLRAHNWTYVHALHTDESYGVSGMAAFRGEAARAGVCVARAEPLRAQPTARDADAALARLVAADPGVGVALCWCEGRTARAMLAAIGRRARSHPTEAPLRLVASDGWADRRDVVAGLETAAAHALTVRIRSPYLTHFDAHYHALDPRTNARNPWFREFWEYKFDCSLSGRERGRRRCHGNESLAHGYTQEPKLALVVRGVWALAHALRDMMAGECGAGVDSPAAACPALRPFNVSLYRRYLARVRFVAPDGGTVAFDDNGDPPPELSEYDVMSWEQGPRGGWDYVRVGGWRGGQLRLKGGAERAARRAGGAHAACGRPCGAGQWARRGAGRPRCCWECRRCGRGAVPAAGGVGCRRCAAGSAPDATHARCRPAPLEWAGRGSWARALAAGAGSAGLAGAALTAAVLWRHRRTPVVKSASRELCALLVGSAAVCHAAALCAASWPSAAACCGTRLGPPALGGVYAAVLTRTVRVERLVAAAERARRPRLASSNIQVVAWVALSSPGALAALWAALRWPAAPRELHPTRARRVLACGGEHARAQLWPLAPALALLALCVLWAWRTRHLPHNLRETRWIGAAAYATGVAWAAAGPLHAALAARSLALAALVSLSAGACVALALGPRLWVCLCRPQRNTRAHFLTTSIRCHVGRYRPSSGPLPPRARPTAATQTPPPPLPSPCSLHPQPCVRVRRLPAPGPAGDGDAAAAATALVVIELRHHLHAPLPPAPLYRA